jgi:hypothetical protein
MRRFAAPLLCLLAASACAHDPYGGGRGYGDDYGYQARNGSGHDMDDCSASIPGWRTRARAA